MGRVNPSDNFRIMEELTPTLLVGVLFEESIVQRPIINGIWDYKAHYYVGADDIKVATKSRFDATTPRQPCTHVPCLYLIDVTSQLGTVVNLRLVTFFVSNFTRHLKESDE